MWQASNKSPPSFMREFSVNMGIKRATLVAKRAGPKSESLDMLCFKANCLGFLRQSSDMEREADRTEAQKTCCCKDIVYHCNEESSQKQQQKLSSQHRSNRNHHPTNQKISCGDDCPSCP